MWEPKSERPAPDYRTGPITRTARWAALGVTAVVSIVLLATYPFLPDEIPTHFNAAMEADSHGPRWAVLILVAVFAAIGAALWFLAVRPQLFNYPVRVTEANAQALYTEGETMIVGVASGVAILYIALGLAVHDLGGGAVMGIGMLVLVGSVAYGLFRTIRLTSADRRTP